MTTVLTRGFVWVGVALFAYFLLTRLRTLAVLVGARTGLREEAAVRIRPSRLAVETFIVVVILGFWVINALGRGHLDWEVGGSGSGLHLELAGAWFIAGAVGLVAAITVLLLITGVVAFLRAVDLREQFPRSVTRQPHGLRLATMGPAMVFVAPRRSPLVWTWTELRVAAFGIVATLSIEAVGQEVPAAGWGLGETVGDVTDEFELEDRLAWRGHAFTWDELPVFLAAVTGVAPVRPDRLILPQVEMPVGARALGYWFGMFAGAMKARRDTHRTVMLASFDERAHIRMILESTPGPLTAAYLAGDLEGLLHQARSTVFDNLKRRLPGRDSSQMARAYRRGGMEAAAAWMIEKVANYPELFQHGVCAELDRQAGLSDSILSRLDGLRGQSDHQA